MFHLARSKVRSGLDSCISGTGGNTCAGCLAAKNGPLDSYGLYSTIVTSTSFGLRVEKAHVLESQS